MTTKVEKLYKTISDIEDQIKEIQNKCKHTSYRVIYFSWRLGTKDIRRMCNACNEIMAEWPTADEVNKFLDDEEKNN